MHVLKTQVSDEADLLLQHPAFLFKFVDTALVKLDHLILCKVTLLISAQRYVGVVEVESLGEKSIRRVFVLILLWLDIVLVPSL